MSVQGQTVLNIVSYCVSECKTGDIQIAWKLVPSTKKLLQACVDATPTTATETLSDLYNLRRELSAAHKVLLRRVMVSWGSMELED